MARIFLVLIAVLLCESWAAGQTSVENATLTNSSASAATNTYTGGPWISGITVVPSSTSATVNFATDMLGSTQLSYGIDPGYGTLTSETDTSPRVTAHSVSISGLSACSTYHFQALSINASLVQGASSDRTIFTTGCDTLSNPVPTTCNPYNPNKFIHVKSTSDIATVRQNAINDIWRTTHALPTRQPDSATTNIGTTYTYLTTSSMTNLANIDELEINTGSNPWHEEVVLLKPTTSNGKLAIVHQGHCTSGGLANNLNDIGVGPMMTALSNAGFYVLGFQMPYCGNNTPTASNSPAAHNLLLGNESSTFSPLQIFAEPVIVGINYAVANYGPFSQITMIGISGGGWTTELVSALDSRINISFPVSGWYPVGLANTNYTCQPASTTYPEEDYEQGFEGSIPTHFFSNIMSYEDAAIIASSQSHQQIQLQRQADPCCWGGPRYQMYAGTVNNLALYLGGSGFTVQNDTSSTTHEIDTAQVAAIMAALGY